jgi:hypothetical protein
MIQESEPNVLEIILALTSAGSFAGGLYRRQQERDQDADDRNHNQKLNQRKSAATKTATIRFHGNPLPPDRGFRFDWGAEDLRPTARKSPAGRRHQWLTTP